MGIALQDNEPDSVYWVNFGDSTIQGALNKGPRHWQSVPKDITQNLRYSAAIRLAHRYSEALALVIQDTDTGEALGALTLETEAGENSDLRSNYDLLAELRSIADLLGPVLARSK